MNESKWNKVLYVLGYVAVLTDNISMEQAASTYRVQIIIQ